MMRALWHRLRTHEPVVFVRMFIGTTGVVCFQTGAALLFLAVWRISHPVPTPLPIGRPMQVALSVGLVLGIALIGASLVMIALSRRLWTHS